MSEESPPPLRLKPRLRPAGELTPVPANPLVPAAETPPEATAPDPSPLRLKPKLAADPAPQQAAKTPAETSALPASGDTTPALEKPRLKPRLNTEPAAVAQPEPTVAGPTPNAPSVPPPPIAPPTAAEEPATEEAPKFKLKPKTPGTAAPISPLSSPPATDASAAPPPVVPVIPPEIPEDAPPPPPLAVKLPPPPAAALKKRLIVVSGVVALFVVAGGLYYGWQKYGETPPAPTPPVVSTPAPAAAAKPPGITPSETLNQIAAMPGAAISKAQDAIAGRREREQERIDAASTGADIPDTRFLDTPLPGQLGGAETPNEPSIARTESQLAPGIRATTSDVTATAQASNEFRAFVGAMTINGVFQGTPPRALINGRTFRVGEVVDQAQGIVFEDAEPATKTITFRDRTGARVSRKY